MSTTEQYKYWLSVAKEVGQRSKCLSRQIGAVLVTPDGTIVGTGYNGPPRGVPHCDSSERLEWLVEQCKNTHFGDVRHYIIEHGWREQCPRRILGFASGEGVHLCSAGHAERNAIVNSAREGIRTKGCYLICSCPLPCGPCAIEIVNAGIVKVVCYEGPAYDNMARWILTHGHVELVQVPKED
jgi:dCMP deaminase